MKILRNTVLLVKCSILLINISFTHYRIKMDQDLLDLEYITELSKELTLDDVAKLLFFLQVPAGICNKNCDQFVFLQAMQSWKEFKPYLFHQALTNMKRPRLIAIASKLTWLCASEPTQLSDQFTEPLTIKTLLTMLRTEISPNEWKLITIGLKSSIQGKESFESIVSGCLEKKWLTKDLLKFQSMLTYVNRVDVAEKISKYRPLFVGMSEEEFVGKARRELQIQAVEMAQWESSLKKFLEIQNKQVKQMLGKDKSVSLAYVFVELTILKQEPREVKFDDETTYNEIAYLRKIARKEITIEPVDFTDELKSYKSATPEIWCLIGNPGCGKTFLAKRTALRFSQYELTQISYSIAIACRNTDWHNMESTRIEEDRTITAEFVQDWLCIGLPVASEWPKDLSKHLTKSDGEGLLLIIDGLDEFTKKIPFGRHSSICC